MIIDRVDARIVQGAIELALRAPSIHNSQPWRWEISEHAVELYADATRWLPATDADGRDLVVSCGAALHHLRVALAAAGLHTTVARLPDSDQDDHLAAVDLQPGDVADTELALASRITQRRSDRRPFSDWPVPEDFVQRLERAASEQGAILRVIDDGLGSGRARRGYPRGRTGAVRDSRVPHRAGRLDRAPDRELRHTGGQPAQRPGPAGRNREFSPGDLEIDPRSRRLGSAANVRSGA